MKNLTFRWVAAILALIVSNATRAQSSCSAENPDQGQRCSITCSTGQRARCEDATGNGYPYCECEVDWVTKLAPTQLINEFASEDKNVGLQHTNIIQEINKKLAAFDYEVGQTCRQVKVGRECYDPNPIAGCPQYFKWARKSPIDPLRCRGLPVQCTDIYESRCSPTRGPILAREPIIVEIEPIVIIDEPNWDSIPTYFLGFKQSYKNCSSTKQSQVFRHVETAKIGSRVVKTKIVEAGREISAKVSFNFVKVGGEASTRFSSRTSITDSKEENQETTQSIENTIPLEISAKTHVTITHYYIQRETPVNFRGTVQVDAAATENTSGVKLISQILQNPKDRIFEFSGTVLNSSILEGDTVVDERKLLDADCRGSAVLEVRNGTFVNKVELRMSPKKAGGK